MHDDLVALGFKLQEMIAGFIGGAVSSVVMGKTSQWYEIVGSVFVGMFSANYLGEILASKTGMNNGSAGFIVGLCALIICQGIISSAKKWSSQFGGVNDAGKP